MSFDRPNYFKKPTEPFIFDRLDMSDFQLGQILTELDASTSNSSSPNTTISSPNASETFDWMKETGYDASVPWLAQSDSWQNALRLETLPCTPSFPTAAESDSKRQKRREQNRRSQRAFRERQDLKYRSLQAAYDALLAQHQDLIRSFDEQSSEKRRLLSMLQKHAMRILEGDERSA